MALVENAISAVTIALPEWLEGRVLKEGQIIFVRGWGRFLGGDGVTAGGIDLGSGGGSGTGDAIAFRVIAVKGAPAETWVQADQVNDVLTLAPLRGLSISPIAGTDEIGIGFPDGGTFNNVWTWVGNTWAPNPIPPQTYEPQPGEIPVDYLLEGERKVWDGWMELDTYLPATNPAGTVSYGGATFPKFGPSATNLLRARKRIPLNAYTGLSVVIRGQCTVAANAARMVARLGVVSTLSADPTFEDDALLTVTVPASGLFDVEIPLVDIGSAAQGSTVLLEFGRLGADGADSNSGDIIVDEAWMRLLG